MDIVAADRDTPGLPNWLHQQGYLFGAWLADGGIVAAIPQIAGGVQVGVGDVTGWAEKYTFIDVIAAVRAVVGWDPSSGDELEGWIRHQPSNRRRPAGDPSKEYIHP